MAKIFKGKINLVNMAGDVIIETTKRMRGCRRRNEKGAWERADGKWDEKAKIDRFWAAICCDTVCGQSYSKHRAVGSDEHYEIYRTDGNYRSCA